MQKAKDTLTEGITPEKVNQAARTGTEVKRRFT